MKTRTLNNRLTRIDIAALLAFAAIWIYHIVIVRYGVCYPDEHFYLTIAQRFAEGDRPLVDEWHLSQFSSLFLYLPYKLFTAVNGSTDGITLFMRYLFVACNAVFFWTMYIRLRRYGWHALIAAILFCVYIPGGLFACNYYTMAIRFLMIACLVISAEKQSAASLLLAGVALSCAVLYQPGIAFLYFGYSILVWIRFFRKRKGKRFLNDFDICLSTRSWKILSLSVLFCAAVFLCGLLIKSGARNILNIFPHLFTDPEFDFYTSDRTFGFVFRAAQDARDIYGLVCLIPAFLIAALSIAYACGLFRNRRDTVRKILFCSACALWILSCVYPFRPHSSALSDAYFSMYPAAPLWFGLVCYLLCAEKNKQLFFFWVVGAVSSVCIDFLSNTGMSLGCPIAYIADIAFFTQLLGELRDAHPAKKAAGKGRRRDPGNAKASGIIVRGFSRVTCVCFALWLVFTVFSENTVFPQHFLYRMPLSSFTNLCKSGPDRSLHFPEPYGVDYAKRLADMDAVRQRSPKNLYVCGMAPELYLYARLPQSTYSSWSWRKKTDLERHVLYWTVHPEKKPECIYVPFHEANDPFGEEGTSASALLSWIRDAFDPLCTYTPELGQGGCILYVSQWHLNAETAEK